MIRTFLAIASAALVFLTPCQAMSFCFDDAGRTYGVSPSLLQGIARVESKMNPLAVNHNTNGSTDLGLMQVNSFWLKTLGVSSRELVNDPCYNVMAGAWILKGCLDRHGETWEAVGCYNATSRNKRVDYSWKVYRELLKGARTDGSGTAAASGAPYRQGTGGIDSSRDGNGKRNAIPLVSSMQMSVADKN